MWFGVGCSDHELVTYFLPLSLHEFLGVVTVNSLWNAHIPYETF